MVLATIRPRAALNLLHFIENTATYQAKIGRGVRCLGSSPPEGRDALSYLKSWVGNSNNNTRPASSSHHSSIAEGGSTTNNVPLNSPPQSTGLTVSGASYLLPTLCLERSETPTTLSTRLQSYFNSSGAATSAAIRAMLRPKAFNVESFDSPKGVAGTSSAHLKVPIILDMKAFQHDGSPHYKPPVEGSLKQIVGVLNDWGIAVLGLTNISRARHNHAAIAGLGSGPNGGGGDSSATRLEEEAMGLGLPVLMARAGRTLGGSVNSMHGVGNKSVGESLQLEDVVQLLITQAESTNSLYDDDTVGSTIGDDHDSTTDVSKDLSSISPLVMEVDIQKKHELINNTMSPCGIIEDNVENLADTMMSNIGGPLPGTLPTGTKIFHGSVRSGVIISTDKPNQSLVIIGNVNSGGEVMAEGNLFVFGRLRGRALAGLAASKKSNSNLDEESRSITASGSNSMSASIFASNFDPELICIGESFTTIDSVKELGLKRADAGAMVTVDNEGELVFVKF